MRFIVGQSGGTSALHVLTDDKAIDLTRADPTFGPDLESLIRSGREGLDRARRLVATASHDVNPADITPDLPLRSSGKIICLGLNYVDHAKEGGYDVPDYPALFMRGHWLVTE